MAEDQFELTLFEASFGGLELDLLATDDDLSRVLAEHEYPYRNGATLEDAGAAARRTDCEVVFCQRGGEDGEMVLDRLAQFLGLLSEPGAKIFVHPLTGAYSARPEGIRVHARAEDRDYVTVSVTFVEDGLDVAAFQVASVDSAGTEAARVGSARVALEQALADAPDPETTLAIGADAEAAAVEWRDDVRRSSRQVNLELGALTNRINDEMDRLELASDLSRYPTLLALQRLQGALRRAGVAAIRTAPRLTELTVRAAAPLLVLLAEHYGGEEAAERLPRVLELNDIEDPSMVPAGTALVIEAP